MTKEFIIEYLSKHKNEFFQKFGVTKLGLFGSYVRGDANNNSDIDILIELEDNLTNIHEKKLELKKNLEDFFHLKVDIAREKYLKPFSKQEILKEVEFA